jgi:hypothetical protein
MILPETPPPTLWPPRLTSAEDHERLDRALKDLVKEDQWVADFIKRLNYTAGKGVSPQCAAANGR